MDVLERRSRAVARLGAGDHLVGGGADLCVGQQGFRRRGLDVKDGVHLTAFEQEAAERRQPAAGRGAVAHRLVLRPAEMKRGNRPEDRVHAAPRAGLIARRARQRGAGTDLQDLFERLLVQRLLDLRPDLAVGRDRHFDPRAPGQAFAQAAAGAEAVGDDRFEILDPRHLRFL